MVLEIRGISKRFGSIQALDDVSLKLEAGEIHALLGENGAGKSTLIKIMTGVEQPDAGELYVDGRLVRVGSALEAQALGIAAVYQEPMIFPDLSVAENIFISHRDRGRIVDRAKMRRDAAVVLERLGARLDVGAPARRLTLAPPPPPRNAPTPSRAASGPRSPRPRAADSRDRQGALASRSRPDHGRADGISLDSRDAPPL